MTNIDLINIGLGFNINVNSYVDLVSNFLVGAYSNFLIFNLQRSNINVISNEKMTELIIYDHANYFSVFIGSIHLEC